MELWGEEYWTLRAREGLTYSKLAHNMSPESNVLKETHQSHGVLGCATVHQGVQKETYQPGMIASWAQETEYSVLKLRGELTSLEE